MNIEGETAMKGMDLGRNVELCCQSLRLKEDAKMFWVGFHSPETDDHSRFDSCMHGICRKGWCFCV